MNQIMRKIIHIGIALPLIRRHIGLDLPLSRQYRTEKILGYLWITRQLLGHLWITRQYSRYRSGNRGFADRTYTTQTKGRIRYLNNRSYSSTSNSHYYDYWDRLQSSIESVRCKTVYPGSIYASTSFIEPYPRAIDFEVVTLAFIQLLEQYAYHIDSEYLKLTIGYTMQLPSSSDLSFTLGKAIPLCDPLGNRVPKKMIYEMIERQVRLYGEQYQDAVIKGVFIRIYYEAKDSLTSIAFPKISDMISQIINVMDSEIGSGELPEVKSLLYKKSRIPTKISSIKSKTTECRPFIVADIETLLVNNVHVPYAAGYLVVNPGDNLTSIPSYSIHTFFSENHITFYPNFEDRSKRMFFDFLSNLEVDVTKNSRIRTVYFHNFARFDGIIILRYYADRGNQYKIKTLLRNHKLYELKVYLGDKLLLRFRDSCTLLPSRLDTLAKTLCPELGSKGSIPHDDLKVSNLLVHSEDLINYLRQDILLLGGVMLKAQEINWSKYHIDIEDVMTLSSLSLKIFRQNYFDDETFPIHIPTKNQDTFIRRGYYGGHADVYKPYGDNLYYYDVNSLYPFIMKEYPMPCGIPVWQNNLESVGLDSLFGFIEAYVVCPTNISRPFLPYRDKKGTLLFPTGKFIGVFYSEELKFARDLGYHIIPLRGYLFEKKSSPFQSFISHLYESRLEAKKAGDEAMTYIYKILMNSLYGRFGMNPESTVTEICNQKKYEELMKKDNFQSAEKLTDHYYIVNYISNSIIVDDNDWKAPKMSAVQLSAAITACARIHMYPFISRPDCYYTDTDSIILGSPLSDDLISSIELGKFKLECNVKRGIFLAPKSYMLDIEDDRNIIKHKGPAKDLVTSEWFKRQLADLSLTEQISTSANFRIDWKELKIVKKELLIKLGLPLSTKRENVYDSNNVWIDTRPIDVIDLGTTDATTIYKYEVLRINEEMDKIRKMLEEEMDKNNVITEKMTKLLYSMKIIDDENKSLHSKYMKSFEEEVSQSTNEGQKTITLYNNKPKKAKHKKAKGKKPKENDTRKKPKPDE